MKTYTALMVYADNLQRYATSVEAESPEEALENAIMQAREDNQDPGMVLEACGIVEGAHNCVDIWTDKAAERPSLLGRLGKKSLPFTVFGRSQGGDIFTRQVLAPNAKRAEHLATNVNDLIAGVLSGHHENLCAELNHGYLSSLKISNSLFH
jgi:hypothetical protein